MDDARHESGRSVCQVPAGRLGPDRIMFGTDSSWFPRGFVVSYFEEQLRICRRLNVSDEGVDKIFYANAARLLKI
ncbi:MAG: amidohydrolase family protein [Limnochordia bacterium]